MPDPDQCCLTFFPKQLNSYLVDLSMVTKLLLSIFLLAAGMVAWFKLPWLRDKNYDL